LQTVQNTGPAGPTPTNSRTGCLQEKVDRDDLKRFDLEP
jgi:hypothetical protein